MHVGITGASGLIGTALSRRLSSSGHTVTAFVRRPATDNEIEWDPAAGRLDPAAVQPLDAVVHLAGAGIGDRRWTDEYRAVLRSSRVDGTSLISSVLADLGTDGPQVLVSASGIGFYGDRGDEIVDETSPIGTGFLAELCKEWEASTAPASEGGIRVPLLRTGIVLAPDGGALKRMLPLFKLGAGGPFGRGNQWMSWISLDDEVNAIEHLLTAEIAGPVNLTAPNPVRNREFADTLGDVLNRPSWLPVPRFGPKLIYGNDLAESLVYEGQRVMPTVLDGDDTFTFEHPDLATALRAVLDR